jgi:hypothetical protein
VDLPPLAYLIAYMARGRNIVMDIKKFTTTESERRAKQKWQEKNRKKLRFTITGVKLRNL